MEFIYYVPTLSSLIHTHFPMFINKSGFMPDIPSPILIIMVTVLITICMAWLWKEWGALAHLRGHVSVMVDANPI